MEKFRDPKEPKVIDKDLILKLIYEQGPQEEAGRIVREDGLLNEEIKNLRIEYMNILRIDNLWDLKALVKLKLCCNFIEKIENLEELINLKELDLSFNKIEKLENLNHLVQLEIFIIFENKISQIENIDNLKNLIIANFGNNNIQDWNCVNYLNEFPNLKALNLAGNPCFESPNFFEYIVCLLPNLVYYEYKLITPEQREDGLKLFSAESLKLNEELSIINQRKEEALAKAKEREFHKLVFVDGFIDDEFYYSLFENDPEGNAFSTMNEDTIEIYDELRINIGQICQEIFDNGFKNYEIRSNEIKEFETAVKDAKQESDHQTRRIFENYIEGKTQVFFETKKTMEQISNEIGDVTKLMDRIDALTDQFIALIEDSTQEVMCKEIIIKEQLDEVISNFEHNLLDLVSTFIENIQASFSVIRGFEWDFVEFLGNETTKFQNTIALMSDDPDFYISDELKQLFVDKDSLNNAMTSTREAHFLVIDTREDNIIKDIKSWAEDLINNVKLEEIERNRRKLREIRHFFDLQGEEFDQLTNTNDSFST